MTQFYDLKPEYTNAFITILAVSIGYPIYWFLAMSNKIKLLFFDTYSEDKAWVRYVVYQKLMGVAFKGLFPGIIVMSLTDYTFSDFGMNLGNYSESMVYIICVSCVMLVLNFFVSKNAFNLNMYPQMRLSEWDPKRIAINALAWAAYMFAYEFMYRGLLLIVCYHAFGFWPAVAINIAYYMATHIAKGLTETLGALPYGLLLCFVTISTGSIVFAFVTHVILAYSNDYYSIYHNPEMRIVRRVSD